MSEYARLLQTQFGGMVSILFVGNIPSEAGEVNTYS
jgi:hypothetical protein